MLALTSNEQHTVPSNADAKHTERLFVEEQKIMKNLTNKLNGMREIVKMNKFLN